MSGKKQTRAASAKQVQRGTPSRVPGGEKHETRKVSARAGRDAGSGARGRQGVTMERSPTRRRDRVATGTASTERDQGRSKTEREGREHREGTG